MKLDGFGDRAAETDVEDGGEGGCGELETWGEVEVAAISISVPASSHVRHFGLCLGELEIRVVAVGKWGGRGDGRRGSGSWNLFRMGLATVSGVGNWREASMGWAAAKLCGVGAVVMFGPIFW